MNRLAVSCWGAVQKKLYVWKKRIRVCAQVCVCVCAQLYVCVYMCTCMLVLVSQGVECIRPGVFFPLGNCPFHVACFVDWTLCLLVLWSQECTCTNLCSSTRCGLGTLGKRKSLSVGLQRLYRVTLVITQRGLICG